MQGMVDLTPSHQGASIYALCCRFEPTDLHTAEIEKDRKRGWIGWLQKLH